MLYFYAISAILARGSLGKNKPSHKLERVCFKKVRLRCFFFQAVHTSNNHLFGRVSIAPAAKFYPLASF